MSPAIPLAQVPTPQLESAAMRWAVVAGVLVVVAGLAGGVAHAEDVRLVVAGDDVTVTDLVAGAATARLRALGHVVRPVPKGDPIARGFIQCARQAQPACKLTAADGTAFALVVEVKVTPEPDGRRVDVTAWLLEGSGGARLSSDQGTCQACEAGQITGLIVGLAERLVREGRARMGTTRLHLASSPPGATVELDGEVIGVTNTDYTTYPGAHRVRFSLTGHDDAVQDIVAHPNAQTAVEVQMRPLGQRPRAPKGDAVSPPGPPERQTRWRGWAAGGTGLALALSGAVLIAIDEDRGTMRRESYTDTAPYGVALLAAGVLAGGLGGYWLWADAGRGDEPAEARALVGIGGRF